MRDPEPLLARLRAAVTAAGLWAELATDWLVLDAALLPWSAAAGRGLLEDCYAPTAAAALADLRATADVLTCAAGRGIDIGELPERTRARVADAGAFDAAWRAHAGLGEAVRLAPFCVLAGEGAVHAERPVAPRRRYGVVGIDGGRGGGGRVVKPAGGCERGPRGLVQPGLKVRGPAYLRLVYGPHYTEHLGRLRERHVGRKRALALREYALGPEAMHRFVEGEPLWRVHQAVTAVLALESQPVDPRL